MPPTSPSERGVRKVLVMELAGLGDNVHLLPALWLVRRRWAEAQLHVMVYDAAAPLFRLAPWVDRVWAYPASPKPGLAGNLRWVARLRRERFDCAINTTGSDRSSMLTWASGAPVRIGRRPADGGPFGWAALFTQVLEEPYYREPMYVQKWKLLRTAGFGDDAARPEFHFSIEAGLRVEAGLAPGDERGYVHVSPFTSPNPRYGLPPEARELPLEQLAALLDRVRELRPELRIVLTCAGDGRSRSRMAALVASLREPPWKVHAGDLDVAALAALIESSALSLSADTGSLHLAMMAGTPTVAWIRAHRGQNEWIPAGDRFRVLVAEGGGSDALHGIGNEDLLAAVRQVLPARP
jgi:ADP-heptose:LPS heptosyltransferase